MYIINKNTKILSSGFRNVFWKYLLERWGKKCLGSYIPAWLSSASDRAVRVDPETLLGNVKFPETNPQAQGSDDVQLSLRRRLLPSGQSCPPWHSPALAGWPRGCSAEMVPSCGPEALLPVSRADAQCVAGQPGLPGAVLLLNICWMPVSSTMAHLDWFDGAEKVVGFLSSFL